ncbi:MFS transporter [Actinomadura barringtoniae]|uniref:MFS transporter n=1 Tax=Actinomadura barringtoniae TaxID=1427535 RepID=A0A939PKC3_9ACTN|nr:MFS transporter [Actinomadura barringtoniae]MBO2454230.1 MFS transporter [Actinomadura barringtoniae]
MEAVSGRHPKRWLILVVLCLSTLVLVIDNMVLTVAVPPLAEDIGATAQDAQWILESYILVFAGLLLTAGSLSDRFGRRRVMLIGLSLFGLASLAATFAADPGQLIAARVVMGVGGALIMPSTLSILITVFDDEERRKAMAAWSSVAMVGFIGGPVLGGALISWFWWGAVFLINVPVVVLAIVAALVWMPESKGPWSKPDLPGAFLSVVGMTSLVWAIIEWPKLGISHPHTLAAFGVAVAALAAFVIWELRTDSPMVPLGLFKARNFSGGSFSLTLVQIGNGGLLLVLTQYLQYVLGYSPTKAGLAFIPMAIASLAFNGLGAAFANKIGNRIAAAIGLAVIAAGFGLLATLTPDSGFWMLSAALFIMGAGGGLAMPAAVSALMAEVPAEQAGVGSALNDTIQQAGAALGVAILGSVLAGGFNHHMPAGAPRTLGEAVGDPALAETARSAFTSAMHTSFTLAAVGALTAAVVALTVMRNRKNETPGQPATELVESAETTETGTAGTAQMEVATA